MAVSGAAVSVSAWSKREYSAPASRAGHLTLSVVMGGENSRSSGGNKTCQETWKRIGVALVASRMFFLTLIVRLGTVAPLTPPLDGGVKRGTLLHQSYKGQISVHARPLLLYR